jgi:GAF domain-containing protein
MLTWARHFLSAPTFTEDEEKTRIAALLNTILLMLFFITAVVSVVMTAIDASFITNPNNWIIMGILVGATLGLRALMRGGNVRVVSGLLSLLFWASITFSVYNFGGIHSPDTAGYLIVIVTAGLLLGAWSTIIFAVLSIAAVGALWYAETIGALPSYPVYLIYDFVLYSVIFIITALLLRYAVNSLSRALERARRNEHAQLVGNLKLQQIRESLEEIVAERTQDLRRRSEELRMASEVARDATAAHDLDDLLKNAADQIRERFNFHHVSIFLVDEIGEYAVLRAATGDFGHLVERGHQLPVSESSLVGSAVAGGRARITLNAGDDAVNFVSPLLPETRSEMALPLRIGERVIGALDIHSTQATAFDEADVQVFQTLADQLAVAVENARLIHALQQNLREIEAVYGRYTQDAWSTFIRGASVPLGYRYRHMDVEAATEQHPEAHEALQQGRSVATSIQAGEDSGEQAQVNAVAVPIKLRNQVIGVLDLRAENQAISPEAISLTEEVADRLAMALENARLFDEARLRAVRERALNQVMARFARSFDVDTVLQTAVRELGQLPRVTEVSVQVGLAEAPSPANEGGEVDHGEAN